MLNYKKLFNINNKVPAFWSEIFICGSLCFVHDETENDIYTQNKLKIKVNKHHYNTEE